MIINKQTEQYLIAHQTGIKSGQKIAGGQQSSSRKLDPEKLNKHLSETRDLYKKGKFTEIKTKEEPEEASSKTSSEKSEGPEEKKFLLEGTKDIYGSLPEAPSEEGSRIYPTLETKLFPALDAMEETVKELGPNPTPSEVDRSNVRRLIRAFQPVAEAFEGSYDEKDFKTAMKSIQKLASNFGKFKDVSVIETELKGIYPNGKIPEDIKKKLDEHRNKQEKIFNETYKNFRKKDMDKAIEILKNPEPVKKKKLDKMEEKDTKKLSKNITTLIDDVEEKGLVHTEPEAFHEGRKAMRTLLNSMNASQDTFGFGKKDVDSMTALVDIYGQAQDKNIACEWLRQNGFEKEATKMLDRYEESQKKALEEAGKFLESGTLERIRKTLET